MATTTTSPSGSISGRYWMDANGNGIQDVGELAQANARVSLYTVTTDQWGWTAIHTTSVFTDAKGNYKFDLLGAGTYQIAFALPKDSKSSPADAGTNDTKDSDAGYTSSYRDSHNWVIETTNTSNITLKAGENKIRVDGGFVPLTRSYTSGYVTEYKIGDSEPNANGPGIADVSVRLVHDTNLDGKTTADEVVAVTTTNADGWYEFRNDFNGAGYRVEFGLPTGFYDDGFGYGFDHNEANRSRSFDLVDGKSLDGINLDLDCNYFFKLGTLGGSVWNDADADGERGANEGGMGGVRVELYANFGGGSTPDSFEIIDETITDSSGNYKFSTDISPDDYLVKFVAPDGTVLTTAESAGVVMRSGETNLSVNAGVFSDSAPVPAGLYEMLTASSTLEVFLGADAQSASGANAGAMPPQTAAGDMSQAAAEILRKLTAAMAQEAVAA